MNSVYSYSGPVMNFDRVMADNWKGETVAPSEKKALSNLAFQFKKQNGLEAGASIKLTGKLKKEEAYTWQKTKN